MTLSLGFCCYLPCGNYFTKLRNGKCLQFAFSLYEIDFFLFFSVSVFQFILVKLESKLEMHAGNSTGKKPLRHTIKQFKRPSLIFFVHLFLCMAIRLLVKLLAYFLKVKVQAILCLILYWYISKISESYLYHTDLIKTMKYEKHK